MLSPVHQRRIDATTAAANRAAAAARIMQREASSSVAENRALYRVQHCRNFTPDRFGSATAALHAAEVSGTFLRWLVSKDETYRMDLQRLAPSWSEERALGGQSNASGGYLVPHELSGAVIALMEEFGAARRLCRVFQMASDKLSVPIREGGIQVYAVGENATVPPSDKKWRNVTLSANKFGALVKYSSEIAEDAVINLADDLIGELAHAFGGAEDRCMILGDGTSAFHGMVGILNALADGCKKSANTDEDAWSKITTGSITKAAGALPGYAKAGKAILCNPAVKGAVFDRLLIAAGGNTADAVANGQPSIFNGMEIVTSEFMPATDGADEILCAIGNFSQAVALGDRRAVRTRVLYERFADEDQIAVIGTCRFDIVAHQKGTATEAGPVILLSTAS